MRFLNMYKNHRDAFHTVYEKQLDSLYKRV